MPRKLSPAFYQQDNILSFYRQVRLETELLCEPLEIEDYGIQTMADVSPVKWHLAHTSWFFETMLLKEFDKNYLPFNPGFDHLFNSYYDTIGNYFPRERRGTLSRPTVKEIIIYRNYVDNAMVDLLSSTAPLECLEILARTYLGLNHEQQHQELILMDIKHIFASNPLLPVYNKTEIVASKSSVRTAKIKTNSKAWLTFDAGLYELGFSGKDFHYDNEVPQHKTYLEGFKIAAQPVLNRDYLEFIDAGGYRQSALWLSDAWKLINDKHWQAPLYWQQHGKTWFNMTLSGLKPIDGDAPVCHVSYFEAAAYARWYSETQHLNGVRLPTEAEWEIAAAECQIEGNFRESNYLQPQFSKANPLAVTPQQMFGDVWEWTQSAYCAYPGYRAENGALGEYNGKFMSNQMVLRGGSCVTSTTHIRRSYRNFFYPQNRWQFSGFRLASSIGINKQK